MGLTHHWHRPTELPTEAFRAAVDDCRRLFEAAGVDLAGFDGTGTPLLTAERIVFNGAAPAACEPFEVAAVEFDRRGRQEFFGHCKTEHLPYDLCVRAALIVLHHHLQDAFRVSSDDGEWKAAQEWVSSTLGYGSDFILTPG